MIVSVFFEITNRQGKGYPFKLKAIHNELTSDHVKCSCKVSDHYFFVHTEESMEEIQQRIRRHLNKNDVLVLLEIPHNPDHSGWANKEAWEWLKKHADNNPMARIIGNRMFAYE